ncbi:MAG: ammonia-forming cytochrome c nitrite reductase subunit c552 [Coriobacteriales bacterium]|jgi:nitrite reductase (cytochrome c-552)|nr:ammonia-forming cytochrome c nitrite reductase subunit c552 [Coriobacteriales bacterium]
MKGIVNKARVRNLLVAALICVLFVALAACAPKVGTGGTSGTTEAPEAKVPVAAEPSMAKDAAGVWTAEAWKDIYPHEYESFMLNEMNKTAGNATEPMFEVRGDMTEIYPMIKTIWAGSPFSLFYNEPNGHNYALDDIRATGRVWDAEKGEFKETAFANCLTCKSADFTALYDTQGNAIFGQPIASVSSQLVEAISCYNCHGNTLSTDATSDSLTVTQKFFKDGVGLDASKVDVGAQTCGQCHNEYYFAPADKAVTNPYVGLAQMTPEAMYEYYKTAGKDGAPFVDYTNPNTGTKQLKAQHPEFETIYGGTGSRMAGLGYSCVDCHMGNPQTATDGTVYTSHLLSSPLENKELLSTTCNAGAGCHTDLAAQVKTWQTTYMEKVLAVGTKLEDLNKKLADAVVKATMTEDTLNEVRELNRESQWYWDFVMVENSDGAHNPTLFESTIAKSEAAADKALAYF